MWCLRLVVSLSLWYRLRQCSLHARTEMPKLPESQQKRYLIETLHLFLHSTIFSSSELTNKAFLAPACHHSSCQAWNHPLRFLSMAKMRQGVVHPGACLSSLTVLCLTVPEDWSVPSQVSPHLKWILLP